MELSCAEHNLNFLNIVILVPELSADLFYDDGNG